MRPWRAAGDAKYSEAGPGASPSSPARPRATDRARSYFEGQPPTSPAIAILRDGKLVYLMQRFVIEGATAQLIARNWREPSTSIARPQRPETQH